MARSRVSSGTRFTTLVAVRWRQASLGAVDSGPLEMQV